MFNLFKSIGSEKDYRNYRWFFTSNNLLVVGGKSDKQNELVIKDFLKPDYTIVHTTLPGSPFMIIQSQSPSKKDIEESAVFCACFSKQWKQSKPSSTISIDVFKGEQIYKTSSMKIGTFGIKGDKKTINVKPELVIVIQKGKIRAVPKTTKEEKLVKLVPGKLSKEEAAEKISKIIKDNFNLPISKEEIMQAIPSDNIGIR